jgi:hypothetical protein
MHPTLPGITERRAEFDAASHRLERAVATISGVRCSYEV